MPDCRRAHKGALKEAVAFAGVLAVCVSVAPAETATLGNRAVLHSEVLGEARPYWVALPEGYASGNARHPVVYLLDGAENFRVAAGVMDFLSRERAGPRRIPSPIIIAIENTQRVRDFTPTRSDKNTSGASLPGHEHAGGAHDFLEFLDRELIPSIAGSYRTSTDRVLVGHSYGGLFSLYAFLEQPQLFSGIVAIDPSLYFDDAVLVRRARQILPRLRDVNACVYIAIADHPRTAEFAALIEGIERFAKMLRRSRSQTLRSTLELISGENHSTIPLRALYHGLPFAFTGIAPSRISFASASAPATCGRSIQ